MTNQKTAIANDDTTGGTVASSPGKTAQASGEKNFNSDERRVQDALEDDEVREVLHDLHRTRGAAN